MWGDFSSGLKTLFVHQFTTEKKLTASLTVAGICILILLCDDLFHRLWNWLISISLQRLKLSGKSLRHEDKQLIDREKYERNVKKYASVFASLIMTAPGPQTPHPASHRQRCRRQTAHPKTHPELWQEDQGTLLLWGGDPAAPADALAYRAA